MYFIWHTLFQDSGFNATHLILVSRQVDCNVSLSANPMHFSFLPTSSVFAGLGCHRGRERGNSVSRRTYSHTIISFFSFDGVSLRIRTRLLHLRWASSFGLVSLELDSMRACVHEIYPDVMTREVWICPILITMETLNSALVPVRVLL